MTADLRIGFLDAAKIAPPSWRTSCDVLLHGAEPMTGGSDASANMKVIDVVRTIAQAHAFAPASVEP